MPAPGPMATLTAEESLQMAAMYLRQAVHQQPDNLHVRIHAGLLASQAESLIDHVTRYP